MKHTKHFDELWFTVVAEVEDGAVSVRFKVYEISGFGVDAVDDKRWYNNEAGDMVQGIADAAVHLHGDVKWDGCSNWHIDECDRVMLHYCGRERMEDIGKIMAACWDWTAELLPTWGAT